MLRDVVAIVDSEVHVFELGVVVEVFGIDRAEQDLPNFDFAVCSERPDPIPTLGGLTLQTSYGLERAATADLVAIPAWRTDGTAPTPDLVEALHAAVRRGATVLSVCSGAFLLAAAGLLEARKATCHWVPRRSAPPPVSARHSRLRSTLCRGRADRDQRWHRGRHRRVLVSGAA